LHITFACSYGRVKRIKLGSLNKGKSDVIYLSRNGEESFKQSVYLYSDTDRLKNLMGLSLGHYTSTVEIS